MLLALALALVTAHQVETGRKQRFDRIAHDTRTAVDRRVARYAEVLFGVRASLMSVRPVTGETFHRNVALLDLPRRLPGARGIEFDALVRPGETAAFEQAMRADPALPPDVRAAVQVHPASTREQYVVRFVEPAAERGAAFGFDVGSDPLRRQAIEDARDTGEIIATRPVVLDGGQGYILFLATYARDTLPVTAPARRRAFVGTFAAGFRVADLFRGVAGASTPLDIEIYDAGATVQAPAPHYRRAELVFSSHRRLRAARPLRGLHGYLDMDVGSRRWRVYAEARPGFATAAERWLPTGVGLAVLVASVLVASLLFSLTRSRRMALNYALDMTVDLRRRESELENVNADLAVAIERAEAADRQKAAFLSTVSHELRTPLFAISGFTSLLLQRSVELDPTLRDFVERIDRNTAAVGTMIEELIDFTRLQREPVPVAAEAIVLSDLVPRVVAQLATVLQSHRVVQAIEPDVVIVGDGPALTRVVTNLLTNATKFSPDGTMITVTVRRSDEGGVVEISDEGPGIAADQRQAVFEPFNRGPFTDAPGPGGTGIGLSVVEALLRLMNGRIDLDAAASGGARFTVTLPGPVETRREENDTVDAGPSRAAPPV
jgi:signal transduction histidine kinase